MYAHTHTHTYLLGMCDNSTTLYSLHKVSHIQCSYWGKWFNKIYLMKQDLQNQYYFFPYTNKTVFKMLIETIQYESECYRKGEVLRENR